MTQVEKQLRRGLLARYLTDVGFAKGGLILSLSVQWRKELWRRRCFRLKEAKQTVAEKYEWTQ